MNFPISGFGWNGQVEYNPSYEIEKREREIEEICGKIKKLEKFLVDSIDLNKISYAIELGKLTAKFDDNGYVILECKDTGEKCKILKVFDFN